MSNGFFHLPDHGLQTVGVRRFQFGKLAVLQNIGNEFVIRCELFEHIGGGGITRLGLFCRPEAAAQTESRRAAWELMLNSLAGLPS